LQNDAIIATIGIGYGDGYPRRLSNTGEVILPDGSLAPIRGRVCMDQICVEVPEGCNVHPGDTVILIGQHQGSQITATGIANLIDATPHEITTCLTNRVQRIAI
jgi:alanine racemase